jgi:hypothetical protein
MTSDRPSFARLATEALAAARIEEGPVSREAEDGTILAIAAAIQANAKARRRRLFGAIGAAVALAAGVALFIGLSHRGAPQDAASNLTAPRSTGAEPARATAPIEPRARDREQPAAPPVAVPEATAAPVVASTAPTPVKPKQDVASAETPKMVPPALASSDLAAQNAILSRAAGAKRRGDRAAAVAAYDELLARYPGGAHAETAEVERMRVLASMDPARGKTAAEEYLKRHPSGFAGEEARRLAGAGKP